MGWGEVASGRLDIIELPDGIFMEPYVQTRVEKLRTPIDEAHAESTREQQSTLSFA